MNKIALNFIIFLGLIVFTTSCKETSFEVKVVERGQNSLLAQPQKPNTQNESESKTLPIGEEENENNNDDSNKETSTEDYKDIKDNPNTENNDNTETETEESGQGNNEADNEKPDTEPEQPLQIEKRLKVKLYRGDNIELSVPANSLTPEKVFSQYKVASIESESLHEVLAISNQDFQEGNVLPITFNKNKKQLNATIKLANIIIKDKSTITLEQKTPSSHLPEKIIIMIQPHDNDIIEIRETQYETCYILTYSKDVYYSETPCIEVDSVESLKSINEKNEKIVSMTILNTSAHFVIQKNKNSYSYLSLFFRNKKIHSIQHKTDRIYDSYGANYFIKYGVNISDRRLFLSNLHHSYSEDFFLPVEKVVKVTTSMMSKNQLFLVTEDNQVHHYRFDLKFDRRVSIEWKHIKTYVGVEDIERGHDFVSLLRGNRIIIIPLNSNGSNYGTYTYNTMAKVSALHSPRPDLIMASKTNQGNSIVYQVDPYGTSVNKDGHVNTSKYFLIAPTDIEDTFLFDPFNMNHRNY